MPAVEASEPILLGAEPAVLPPSQQDRYRQMEEDAFLRSQATQQALATRQRPQRPGMTLGTEDLIKFALGSILTRGKDTSGLIAGMLSGKQNLRDRKFNDTLEQDQAQQQGLIGQVNADRQAAQFYGGQADDLMRIEDRDYARQIQQQQLEENVRKQGEVERDRDEQRLLNALNQQQSMYNTSKSRNNFEGMKQAAARQRQIEARLKDISPVYEATALDDEQVSRDFNANSAQTKLAVQREWRNLVDARKDYGGWITDKDANELKQTRKAMEEAYNLEPGILGDPPTGKTLKLQAYEREIAEFEKNYKFKADKQTQDLILRKTSLQIQKERLGETKKQTVIAQQNANTGAYNAATSAYNAELRAYEEQAKALKDDSRKEAGDIQKKLKGQIAYYNGLPSDSKQTKGEREKAKAKVDELAAKMRLFVNQSSGPIDGLGFKSLGMTPDQLANMTIPETTKVRVPQLMVPKRTNSNEVTPASPFGGGLSVPGMQGPIGNAGTGTKPMTTKKGNKFRIVG